MIALISLLVTMLPIALFTTAFLASIIVILVNREDATADSTTDFTSLEAHPFTDENLWFQDDISDMLPNPVSSPTPNLKTATSTMTFVQMIHAILRFLIAPFVNGFMRFRQFVGDAITDLDLAIEKPLGSLTSKPLMIIGGLSTLIALALTIMQLDMMQYQIQIQLQTSSLLGVMLLAAAIALLVQAAGQIIQPSEHEVTTDSEIPTLNMSLRLVPNAYRSPASPDLAPTRRASSRHPHFWIPMPHLPRGRDGPGSLAH